MSCFISGQIKLTLRFQLTLMKCFSDFLKSKCLMNSEVAILLEHRCEQLKHMSEDSINQFPQYVISCYLHLTLFLFNVLSMLMQTQLLQGGRHFINVLNMT